jgi:hypothetical protein
MARFKISLVPQPILIFVPCVSKRRGPSTSGGKPGREPLPSSAAPAAMRIGGVKGSAAKEGEAVSFRNTRTGLGRIQGAFQSGMHYTSWHGFPGFYPIFNLICAEHCKSVTVHPDHPIGGDTVAAFRLTHPSQSGIRVTLLMSSGTSVVMQR